MLSSSETRPDEGAASREYGGRTPRQPASARSGGSGAQGPRAGEPSSSTADSSARRSAQRASERAPGLIDAAGGASTGVARAAPGARRGTARPGAAATAGRGQ